MPTPVIAGGTEVTLAFVLGNGDVGVNVLHYSRDGDFTHDGATLLAGTIQDHWQSDLRDQIVDEVTLQQIKVADMSAAPYDSIVMSNPVAGTNASDPLAYQLSAVVTLRTAHAGRSGRGRIYTVGYGELANTSTGSIAQGVRDALDTFTTNITSLGPFDGQSYDLVVFSRKNNAMYAVTSHAIDSRWDVQRRRANRRIL